MTLPARTESPTTKFKHGTVHQIYGNFAATTHAPLAQVCEARGVDAFPKIPVTRYSKLTTGERATGHSKLRDTDVLQRDLK